MKATITDVAALAADLDGDVVLPDDPGFVVSRKPALGGLEEVLPRAVVCCATTTDVVTAVRFARTAGLPFALRSGGHSFADFCTTAGLLIDMSGLATARLDGDVVRVGPGMRVGPLAEHLAGHGRVVPAGWCPTVAIGGSVLGGGYGPLSRTYGLGSDHLLAAQVVLSDGRKVWADDERHPELFWALRGAGAGNFGAVTELVLRTRPAPRVSAFVHRWPWRQAAAVIDAWQRWAPSADDDINAELVLTTAGAGLDSEPQVVLFGVVVGATAATARPRLERFLERAGGVTELDELTELSARVAPCRHTYAGMPVGTMVEPPPPAHLRPRLRAVKSEFFDRPLPAAAIEAMVTGFTADREAGQYREVELVAWGGAYRRVAREATAFAHRSPQFLVGHHGMVGHHACDDERRAVRSWVSRSWATVHPYGTGAVYPNYPDRDLEDWLPAYYGANLERLLAVKARYDPQDVYQSPQSLPGGVPS